MKMALAVSLMKTAGVPSLMHFFAHSGLVGVKLPELARPVAQPASENQPVQVTDFDVSPARAIAAVTKQMSGRTIHRFDDTRRQPLVNGALPDLSNLVREVLQDAGEERDAVLQEVVLRHVFDRVVGADADVFDVVGVGVAAVGVGDLVLPDL